MIRLTVGELRDAIDGMDDLTEMYVDDGYGLPGLDIKSGERQIAAVVITVTVAHSDCGTCW